MQIEKQKLIVETPSTSKMRTRSSIKRTTSLKEAHIQSTSPINLDDSQPPSPFIDNLIILADVVAHTMISGGDIDEVDITPLSDFLGKMKKRKMMPTPCASVGKGSIEDPMDVEV